MKTMLSLGLMLAASSALFACSDEGEERRGQGGSSTGNNGGTGGSTAQGGSGGGSQGGSGQGGSGGVMRNYGMPLTITGEGDAVTVVDTTGDTGINGGASVSQSMLMLMPAVHTSRDGALCMEGATAVVMNMDYGAAWGAQIVLDLLRTPPLANPAPDAGDAGAGDAGDVPTVAMPWSPGEVLGFSFKIDGDTVATALSVNSTPTGADPMTDNFCYRRALPPTAGEVIDVLFTDIRRDCWNMPMQEASLFQDPAGYTQLNNFIWQINADTTTAHAFDFCISEIRPILP